MFGKNEITKPFPEEDGSLKVNSLWYTIQGEGPDAGCPAIFLRLSHCNLKCFFCDTEFEKGEVVPLNILFDEILGLSKHYSCKLLVVTGGEPFLQNIIPLIEMVNLENIRVSVETAGTAFVKGIERVFTNLWFAAENLIVCSPKTPKLNAKIIPHIGALKYIVREGDVDPGDGLPVLSTQREGARAKIYRPTDGLHPGTPIYLQPMDEGSSTLTTRNARFAAEICMRYGYRLSIQVHKLVGVE